MRLRHTLAAVALAALVTGAGIITAAPAFAITTVVDVSYEGNGLFLLVPATTGASPTFSSKEEFVDYQLEKTSGGHGEYYAHPYGYDNLCMTASTTQLGVIKTETCDGSSYTQQLWINDECSSNVYQDYNVYWSKDLDDPSDNTATLTSSGGLCTGVGDNGWTLGQVED